MVSFDPKSLACHEFIAHTTSLQSTMHNLHWEEGGQNIRKIFFTCHLASLFGHLDIFCLPLFIFDSLQGHLYLIMYFVFFLVDILTQDICWVCPLGKLQIVMFLTLLSYTRQDTFVFFKFVELLCCGLGHNVHGVGIFVLLCQEKLTNKVID